MAGGQPGSPASQASFEWAPERFTAGRDEAARIAVEVGPADAGASYRNLILSDNPLHYFRLGESSGTLAQNEKQIGFDGTYVNAPALSTAGAIKNDPNTGVLFNGTDEYVSTPITIPAGSIRTFEFWCYRTDNTGYDPLFGNYSATYDLAFVAGDDQLALFNVGGGVEFAWASVPVVGSTYHHVVHTFDQVNNTSNCYLDNALVAGSPATLATDSANDVVIAFGHDLAGGEYFKGALDEIAVYPYALSQAQVTRHYLAGINGFNARDGKAVAQAVNRAAVI